VWTYLVQEELWEADSMTLEEIKASINWSEVCKRISAYRETQKRRDRDSKGINTYWGGSYKDLLPQEMLPPYVSANLLRQLHRPSKVCSLKSRTSVRRLGEWGRSWPRNPERQT
jgi:hypothetical protein